MFKWHIITQTIVTLLTNYKIQAYEDKVAIGGSQPCRKYLREKGRKVKKLT